jgi:hypothetical protein
VAAVHRKQASGLVAATLAVLALGVAACAAPASSPPPAQARASAAPFIVRTATGEVDFPEESARLFPLHFAPGSSAAEVTAVSRAGKVVTLASAGRAFSPQVRGEIAAFTQGGNSAGPVVAGLYSYYNDAYGQIQPDGSVKLSYRGIPVWLFTAPLAHYVNEGFGPAPLPGATPRPVPQYAGCSYVVIVVATTAFDLTDWQNCTHQPAPGRPAPGSVSGKAYPYRLFIHCGVPLVSFKGQTWRAVPPVPRYPGPAANRPDDGYVTGTLALVKPWVLEFAADRRTVAAPYVIFFKPAPAPGGVRQVCA